MKIYLLIPTAILLCFNAIAQQKDTISLSINDTNLSYKHFIIPATLVSVGLVMKNTQMNKTLQRDFRNVYGNNFHSKADNFLQFAPLLQIYGGRYLGLKPKNDFLHQNINIAMSMAIMCGIVKTMKHSLKEVRPDGSNHFSFPSGHTATAFTTASLLFYEYKDADIWYASSGYLFATATGIMRISNNKHYTSDVLAGAGIGVGVGLAVSYWSPFKSITFGKNKKTHALIYPQIGTNYGIGLLIKN